METHRVVVSEVCGGIGNWLFQMCHGFIYAKLHDAVFMFTGAAHPAHTNTDSLFQRFSRAPSALTGRQHRYHEGALAAWGATFLRNDWPDDTDCVVMSGYFQSHEYVSNHAFEFAEFVNLLAFQPTEIENVFRQLTQLKELADICCVHVRRGDYLTLQHVFTCLSSEYYAQCLRRCTSSHVYVFSNDIEWCKSQTCFCQGADTVFVDISLSANETLFAMSQCTEFVLANSTFSLWAALIHSCKRKIKVQAPNAWFAAVSRLTTRRMFPTWIQRVNDTTGDIIIEDVTSA